MKDTVPELNDTLEEKAFSKDQLLRYAKDIQWLYQNELMQRQALEAAVRELRCEVQERIRLQEELIQSEKRYRSLFEDSKEAGVHHHARRGLR